MKGKLGATLLLALSSSATAGGLYVPGQGPVSQERAGADVAAVDDPSAIATNPAGLAETTGTVILVGSNFLDYSLAFTARGSYEAPQNGTYPWTGSRYPTVTNDGTPKIGVGPFQALPELAAVFDLGSLVPGLHVGVGLFVPNSFPTRNMGGDWLINCDDTGVDCPAGRSMSGNPPPPSRYDVVKQDAAIILPAAGVAYKVNHLISVGGRVAPAIGNLEATSYTWGDANYSEDTQHDSVFHVKSSGVTMQFGLGAQIHATDAIDVGLNWDSEVDLHTKGKGDAVSGHGLDIAGMPAAVDPIDPNPKACDPKTKGAIGALNACVDIGLPMVTTVGGRYKMMDEDGSVKGDVELDVAWERWSAVSDYKVQVDGAALGVLPLAISYIKHNFQDVISTRLGGSYRLPAGGLVVRGGVAYDTATARPGWERLDIDGAARTTFGLGVGYPFGKYDVSVGGGYTYEGSRDVGGDCNPTAGSPGCNGSGTDDPPAQRPGPDPIQPLNAGTPFENPINAGKYKSSYVSLSFALVAKF